MWPFETKPAEKVPYQRIPKDGRTKTGFVSKDSINVNTNKLLKDIDDGEMNRKQKGE